MVNSQSMEAEDIVTDEVWALVPARSGSKGIVDKNMQEIQGVSLLGLSVLAGTNSSSIDRCFVSTDSVMYAKEARRYGAEVPFIRPVDAATDSATDLDVFRHFLNWASENVDYLPRAIVHLRPTTPSREPSHVNEAVKLAIETMASVTAIRSVHLAPESPFKWFLRDSNGYLTTFDQCRELDESNRSRAEFEDVYIPNGYADVVFPLQIITTGLLHGNAVRPFLTDPVIEIDGPFELELLRRANSLPKALMTAAADARRDHASDLERETASS
jgi:CMP-N,N'-diacetyllegionaminic acid synthase